MKFGNVNKRSNDNNLDNVHVPRINHFVEISVPILRQSTTLSAPILDVPTNVILFLIVRIHS